MSLDWLIIGGGIHGVHIAARLLQEGDASTQSVRIIDPADQLLDRWRTCTATTGMTHLRSPSVHHIDLDAWSLQRFAGKRRNRKPGVFAAPYERPSLKLFNAHCDNVVETLGLRAIHTRGRASECSIECDGVTVRLDDGRALTAKNIVLAIGASEQPRWPSWAPKSHPRVDHVFESGFNGWPVDDCEQVAIVGGGISAGQVALRLIKQGHRVHFFSRHPIKKHQFDSDSGWLGPKHMFQFSREKSFVKRREMISEARHRGSMPLEATGPFGLALGFNILPRSTVARAFVEGDNLVSATRLFTRPGFVTEINMVPVPELPAHLACLGETAPGSTDDASVVITRRLAEFVLKGVLPDITARAYAIDDLDCANPLAEALSDEDGIVQLDIPLNGANGFDGYIEYTGDSIDDTMVFTFYPASLSSTIATNQTLFPSATSDVIFTTVGTVRDDAKGQIGVIVNDCRNRGLAGATVDATTADDDSAQFYISDGTLSADATATDSSGDLGFLNVLPGPVTLTSTLVEDGTQLAEKAAFTRAGWWSLVTLPVQ